MKKAFFVSSIVACLPMYSFAGELPARKPGLWELKTTMSGVPPQVAKQCIDAATDAKMMKAGTEMQSSMGVTCTKNDSRREGSAYIFETDCTMTGTHVTSNTKMEGDFNAAYTSTTISNYNPPFYGKSEMVMTVEAKYLGECEAGQTPGDIILSNGMKMNMNAMAK